MENETKKTEESKEETVSKKQYDALYNQAVEINNRYLKLLNLYNLMVDKYVSGELK